MARPVSKWMFPMIVPIAILTLFGLSRPVMGQGAPFATPPPGSPPATIRPYGESGVCPEEPALFRRCAVEKAKTFNPPRTPDGRPNFQGAWGRISIRNGENLEEHPETMDGSGGRSAIFDPVDGRIPYQPWAAERRDSHFSTYLDPGRLCVPQGAPRFVYEAGAKVIVQTPGYISIFNDQAHSFRIIPMDGRPRLGRDIRLFNGDSRGRWEGNTLVIDTRNFTDRTASFGVTGLALGSAEELHLEERFTRVDGDSLLYEFTVNDPASFTQPFSGRLPMNRSDLPLYEYACHEGNYGMENLLRGARAEEREAATP